MWRWINSRSWFDHLQCRQKISHRLPLHRGFQAYSWKVEEFWSALLTFGLSTRLWNSGRNIKCFTLQENKILGYLVNRILISYNSRFLCSRTELLINSRMRKEFLVDQIYELSKRMNLKWLVINIHILASTSLSTRFKFGKCSSWKKLESKRNEHITDKWGYCSTGLDDMQKWSNWAEWIHFRLFYAWHTSISRREVAQYML